MMADLIKFGIYTPPSPTQYDVSFSDINGNDSTMEDGTDYIERVRSDIPSIDVGWTNLTQDEVDEIIDEVGNDLIAVTYFFGSLKTCDMKASERTLKLKATLDGETYWNLSFSLEG